MKRGKVVRKVHHPPKQSLPIVLYKSTRPWSALVSSQVGLFAIAGTKYLTPVNCLIFLLFDFGNFLIINGLNDVIDYDIDHVVADQSCKDYYSNKHGWGHVIHKDQFRDLLTYAILFKIPVYIYCFWKNVTLACVLLLNNVTGHLIFNGLLGLPHTNRMFVWKNVVEYYILVGVWLFRLIVTDDYSVHVDIMICYVICYHMVELRLDFEDIDVDRLVGKVTIPTVLGVKNILIYISILRIIATVYMHYMFGSYIFLAINVVRCVYYNQRKEVNEMFWFQNMLCYMWFVRWMY